jgi:hypothetical protein
MHPAIYWPLSTNLTSLPMAASSTGVASPCLGSTKVKMNSKADEVDSSPSGLPESDPVLQFRGNPAFCKLEIRYWAMAAAARQASAVRDARFLIA